MVDADQTDIIALSISDDAYLNYGNYVNRDYDVTIYLNKPTGNYDIIGSVENKDLYATPIARAKNLDYNIVVTTDDYFETGANEPAEIRPGNRTYVGSFERGFVNVAMIRLIVGADPSITDNVKDMLTQSTVQVSTGGYIPISFDIHWQIRDTGDASRYAKEIIFQGATFTNVRGSSRENAYMIETIAWKAKKISTRYSIPSSQSSEITTVTP